MSCETKDLKNKRVLRCAGDLGHLECEEIRKEVLSAFDQHRNLDVDLSRVSEAGTILVQVLLAARRTAAEVGVGFAVSAASDAAKQAFERVGLEVGG